MGKSADLGLFLPKLMGCSSLVTFIGMIQGQPNQRNDQEKLGL